MYNTYGTIRYDTIYKTKGSVKFLHISGEKLVPACSSGLTWSFSGLSEMSFRLLEVRFL